MLGYWGSTVTLAARAAYSDRLMGWGFYSSASDNYTPSSTGPAGGAAICPDVYSEPYWPNASDQNASRSGATCTWTVTGTVLRNGVSTAALNVVLADFFDTQMHWECGNNPTTTWCKAGTGTVTWDDEFFGRMNAGWSNGSSVVSQVSWTFGSGLGIPDTVGTWRAGHLNLPSGMKTGTPYYPSAAWSPWYGYASYKGVVAGG